MKHRWAFAAASLPVVAILTGCPSNTATNWDAQRLDNKPSGSPVAVRVLDMDGDGQLDVVSLWRGRLTPAQQTQPADGTDSTSLAAVVIHFRDGTGWRTVRVHSDARYAEAHGLTLADINQDGVPDIVVAAQDRITCLRAPADPRVAADWEAFDIAASIRDDYKAWYDVAAAQIDGANGLDIVAALNDDGRVVWFQSPTDPGTADGWTVLTIDSASRSKSDSILLVDLDGDDRLDVISSAPGKSTGRVSWYEQPSDPTTEAWTKHVMSNMKGVTRLALGDIDGNGLPDVAAISPDTGQVAWLVHPDTVTDAWAGWVLYEYDPDLGDDRQPIDVAIADVDGDGQLNVVVATVSPTGVFWYVPPDDKRFDWTEQRVMALANVTGGLIAVENLEGGGLPDVIVPLDHASDDSLDRIDRFLNPLTPP